jgi:hypothetical protein
MHGRLPPRQSERKGKVTNPTAMKLEGRDRSRKPRPADQASPYRHGENAREKDTVLASLAGSGMQGGATQSAAGRRQDVQVALSSQLGDCPGRNPEALVVKINSKPR